MDNRAAALPRPSRFGAQEETAFCNDVLARLETLGHLEEIADGRSELHRALDEAAFLMART